MSDQSSDQTVPAPQPDPRQIPASRVVEAIYVDGVIRPSEPLDLPPGTPVRLLVPIVPAIVVAPANGGVAPANGQLAQAPGPRPQAPQPPRPALALGSWLPALFSRPLAARGALAALTWGELIVLMACLTFYSLTRFSGLTIFPIYFFCDEAIQTVLARDLLGRGLRDAEGVFLPPYFLNAEKWNLGLSIYLHTITTALFGVSVFLTRATSAAVSLLAVAAVALTLRLAFESRFWWAGVLALAAAPAWFLHSRTAFETVMMVAFYACFLCCYLLYRYRSPNWLYPALLFGGMTFYSYANGQGVMLVSGVLMLLSDLRYHLKQGWRRLLPAGLLLALLVVPLIRFRTLQPEAYANQLRALDSYWLRETTLPAKLGTFAGNYLLGLSPAYWFLPNEIDLERHRMLGMGHLPLLLLPFVLLGLAVCVQRWRSSAHRAVLIAMLAAPFSMALVGIGITRVLALVVPAALLFTIGLDAAYGWLRGRVRYAIAAGIVAAALGGSSLLMLRAALVDGPTWFTNYSLAGMQYGAEQLFGQAIPAELARSPATTLLVSPTWANNPNSFIDFFLEEPERGRVQLINIDAFTVSRRELDPARMLFVMPGYEYERAQQSGKFVIDPPERIIPYPDGQPGFYFVRMRYVANVDALFEADRVARAQLIATPLNVAGAPATVAYSLLDIGAIENIFDGDPVSLMRGMEANPLVVELRFEQPRSLAGLQLTVGSMNLGLLARATPADGSADLVAEASYRDLPPDPTVALAFAERPLAVTKLRLEIRNLDEGEVSHIHVRELVLR